MEHAIVSREQMAILGATPEDHFHDRKSARIAPASLTKSMSAFANADGGELLVGIEDNGSWVGASKIEDFNGHLQAMEPLFPFGSEFDYEFLESEVEGTFVLRITIQKSRAVKYATSGKAYVRRGAQSLPVDDIADLERKKGLTTYETATLGYATDEITNSATVIEFMLQIVPDSEPDRWLKKQNLIVEGRPTVAGTLLYHDEPQIHIPKAAVKLYRYTTSAAEGTRAELAYQPISIEGPIYDVIRAAVRETVRQVEEIPVLDQGSGLTNVTYPQETLHEIITNAVIHRDYSVNDDVHVRIFENRIEVQSPGFLPAHVTPRNILETRFSRNPVIVRLLNKFPDAPNKDVGEGMNTAFAAMRELELKDPDIIETDDSVIVVIRHEGLASPESRIVAYMEKNETINNREARVLLNRLEAERSMRRIFEKMEKANVIEKVPGTTKGGTRYRIKEDASQAPDAAPPAGDV